MCDAEYRRSSVKSIFSGWSEGPHLESFGSCIYLYIFRSGVFQFDVCLHFLFRDLHFIDVETIIPWVTELSVRSLLFCLSSQQCRVFRRRFRMNSFVSDFGKPLSQIRCFLDRAMRNPSPSFTATSMKWTTWRRPACLQTTALNSEAHLQEAIRCSGRPEEELNRLMKFDIPTLRQHDQNSLGEDDLLASETPTVLEISQWSKRTQRVGLRSIFYQVFS